MSVQIRIDSVSSSAAGEMIQPGMSSHLRPVRRLTAAVNAVHIGFELARPVEFDLPALIQLAEPFGGLGTQQSQFLSLLTCIRSSKCRKHASPR